MRLGLGGVVFALIEQPRFGWSSPAILVPLVGGVVTFAAFLAYERRVAQPMLKLELFAVATSPSETSRRSRCTRVSPSSSSSSASFCNRSPATALCKSGLATLPVTLVMFVLSRRFGALADRYGPRLFMGAGPLVAAAGLLLLLRAGIDTSYVADLLPALLLFALGLSMTVAPLTAAVLADADETDAGIASAINNAIARVAGLVGVSVVGVVVASTLVGDTFAANDESVRAFHQVVVICAALVAAGGIAGIIGIANPRRARRGREMLGRSALWCPGTRCEPCRWLARSARSRSSRSPDALMIGLGGWVD